MAPGQQPTSSGRSSLDEDLVQLKKRKVLDMAHYLEIAAPPRLGPSFGDVLEQPEAYEKRIERIRALGAQIENAIDAVLSLWKIGACPAESKIDSIAKYFSGEALKDVLNIDTYELHGDQLQGLRMRFRNTLIEVGELFLNEVNRLTELRTQGNISNHSRK